MTTTTTQPPDARATDHELAIVAAVLIAKDDALNPDEAIEEARRLIEAVETAIKEARA